MHSIVVAGMAQSTEAGLTTKGTLEERPVMALCCRVCGRERWYVEALEDNPRLAAAVELVLRSEDGILDARANPLTGRVLVRYSPELDSDSIEGLIRRALEFGPMSRTEFSRLRPNTANALSLRHLIAAEIACSGLKLMVLGGCCTLTLGAAALLLLMRRHG